MKPNIIFFMVDQMGQKWLEAPMKPLLPALQAADNPNLFGPEHDPHIETDVFNDMLNGQRDVIAKDWVLERVMRRITLA